MDERSPADVDIALVEDDLALLSALTFALETEGYSVIGFASAEAALMDGLEGVDCLIVDYALPGASGLELLQKLRARNRLVPAILITSHPQPRVLELAAALEAIVVEKPLLSDDLIDEVRRAVRQRRSPPTA